VRERLKALEANEESGSRSPLNESEKIWYDDLKAAARARIAQDDAERHAALLSAALADFDEGEDRAAAVATPAGEAAAAARAAAARAALKVRLARAQQVRGVKNEETQRTLKQVKRDAVLNSIEEVLNEIQVSLDNPGVAGAMAIEEIKAKLVEAKGRVDDFNARAQRSPHRHIDRSTVPSALSHAYHRSGTLGKLEKKLASIPKYEDDAKRRRLASQFIRAQMMRDPVFRLSVASFGLSVAGLVALLLDK